MHTIPNTQQEASLLIELSKVGAAMGLTEAINWIMSNDFDPDYALFRDKHARGGKASFYLATVCDFYHSVGTLVKAGVLRPELTVEYFEVLPLWERVQGWIDGQTDDACGQVWPNFKYLGSVAEELADGTPATVAATNGTT
ncbi:MAG: hypothetical protein H0V47_13730 [Chloroflexia bacterium]|nr:hypothetical protein [Chloroflexia bacterium]